MLNPIANQSIQERLRNTCGKLRTTSIPIKDIIPLLQEAVDELDSLQAKIDRMMLEYEPEEMTASQLIKYSSHQRPI